MKNVFFLQGETKGAASIKVSELFADVEAVMQMEFDQLVELMSQVEPIMEMVYAALEDGAKYGFTHKSKEVKARVCDALDCLLESEVNLLVEQLVKEGSLERMNRWTLADEVSKAVIDLFHLSQDMRDPEKGAQRVAAGTAHRQATEVNASEVRTNQNQNEEENVQMTNVQISGVQITVDQVITTMAAQGLFIGGMATATKIGAGEVVGFQATQNGMLVCIEIGEEVKTIMANKVKAGIHAVEGPAKASTQVPAWEADARGAVDQAVGSAKELSEEEIFEAEENRRAAQRTEWKSDREANAAKVAQSSAAQRILQMGKGKTKEAPEASPAKQNQAARRPAASQNQNQTNGGNVQMNNKPNTRGAQQDRPAQGIAGNKGQAGRRPAAQQNSAPASRNNAPARISTHSEAPAYDSRISATGKGRAQAAQGTVSTGRGSSVRIGAGAPVASSRKPGLGLKAHAPVVNVRGAGQPWYLNERFKNAISGEDFEETRQNMELGITNAIFWTPEAYNGRFNREAKEDELAVLEVFFGSVSIEFRLAYSRSQEAKSPWYCRNITFFEGKGSRDGRWHYTVGQKEEKYAVVVHEDYSVHMATEEDFKVNKDAIQYVGTGNWTNKRIYGLDVSESVIAQVMRWAAFGWECMEEGSAE